MPRPACLEDGYEYRVKQIFKRLRKLHKEEETSVPFEKWIERNNRAVADAFLDDVEQYMGFPEPEKDDR